MSNAAPPALRGLWAPAKINVFLHVLGRRADGKHQVQSVMQLIDLHDTLDVELRSDAQVLRVDVGDTPPDMPAEDLCVRAARLLQHRCAVTQGCSIRLHKRIPSGAGLGGGSSDAATVLMALNLLWRCGQTPAELMALGAQLGADVPFFIFGRSAWAEGLGDELTAFELEPEPLLLVKPPQGVSTAAVYGHVLLPRDSAPLAREPLQGANTLAALMAGTRNDLQAVAELLQPAVVLARELAGAYANHGTPARMSGSGSCVYAASDLPPPQVAEGWLCTATRGLAQHPLHAQLAQQS